MESTVAPNSPAVPAPLHRLPSTQGACCSPPFDPSDPRGRRSTLSLTLLRSRAPIARASVLFAFPLAVCTTDRIWIWIWNWIRGSGSGSGSDSESDHGDEETARARFPPTRRIRESSIPTYETATRSASTTIGVTRRRPVPSDIGGPISVPAADDQARSVRDPSGAPRGDAPRDRERSTTGLRDEGVSRGSRIAARVHNTTSATAAATATATTTTATDGGSSGSPIQNNDPLSPASPLCPCLGLFR